MSELQLGLLAIGVAIVAAVFGYNKWQESHYRREAEASLPRPDDDVLLSEGASRPPPAASARIEPTLRQAGERFADIAPPPAKPAAAPAVAGAPVLSEAIDFLVVLAAAEPLEGRAVIESSVNALGNIPKAVNMQGEAGGEWENLRRDGRYRRVRVGMQLVDRRGAASLQELSAFQAAAVELGAALGAQCIPADLDAALRTAAALDRFSGEIDIQIAVHIVKTGEPFSGRAVQALAQGSGLSLDDDGRFRQRDGEGRELYSLVNEEATPFHAASMPTLRTSAVLAELDVPRAPGGAAAFARFRDFSLQAAASLGGTLVDDNREALSAASFDAIALQLQPVYESMEAHGIAAGGPIALRLFS